MVWSLVDKNGHYDDHGNFVWIDDVYMISKLRGSKILKKLSNIVRKKCRWAKEFYFYSKKHKRVRQYRINQYLKEA